MRRLILLTALLRLCSLADAQSVEHPNVLFVYLDDFGWKDAGFMGSDFFETPNLDQLASEGMIFTDAYAGAANCAPSRACLLSGQYSPRHEIYNVGTGPRGKSAHRRLIHVAGTDILNPQITTWAQVFQSAGYRTASIGKWHLSKDPTDYGFEVNIGGTHSGSPPNGYYPPHRKAPGLETAPKDEYLTDRLTEEADRFIRQSQAKPWLLYLTHFAVHTPLNARRDLVDKYTQKPAGKLHNHVAMATMIEAVDRGIGKIRATLEELELIDNTVIIFSSDNGGYGPATDMAPLKGYKGTYYEGGIRVPLFVRWPSKVKAGFKCDVPVTNVDLFPTLLDIAGLTEPDQPVDGKSLLPLLTQTEGFPSQRAIFWHFPAYLQSYSGLSNEQRDPLFRSRPCSIVRQGRWKLHQYFETNDYELYDLQTDAGETRNLTESQPDQLNRLRQTLKAWQQATAAPLPQKPNPEFNAAEEAEATERKSTGTKKKKRDKATKVSR